MVMPVRCMGYMLVFLCLFSLGFSFPSFGVEAKVTGDIDLVKFANLVSDERVNLARGKPVWVSNTYRGSKYDIVNGDSWYPIGAGKAYDGHEFYYNAQKIVIIDLEDEYEINKFRIRGNNIYGFNFYVSLDNQTWTLVYNKTTGQGEWGTYLLSNPVKARYVKFDFTPYNPSNYMDVDEIEIYQKGQFYGDYVEFGTRDMAVSHLPSSITACVWGARMYSDGTFQLYVEKSYKGCDPLSALFPYGDDWGYTHLSKNLVLLFNRLVNLGALDYTQNNFLYDSIIHFGIPFNYTLTCLRHRYNGNGDGYYTCVTDKTIYGEISAGDTCCNDRTYVYYNGTLAYQVGNGGQPVYFGFSAIPKEVKIRFYKYTDYGYVIIIHEGNLTSKCSVSGYGVGVKSHKVKGTYGTGFAKKLHSTYVLPNEEFTVSINIDPPAAQQLNVEDYYPSEFTLVGNTVTVERYTDGSTVPSQTKTLSVSPSAQGDYMKITLPNDSILQNLARDEFVIVKYTLKAPQVADYTQYTIPSPVISYVSA